MSEKPVEKPAARFVRQFQQQDLADSPDYALLNHTRTHLNSRVLQKKYLTKQLQLLYTQIDKTRNYQEFVDTLARNRSLLSDIFRVEKDGHVVQRRAGAVSAGSGKSVGSGQRRRGVSAALAAATSTHGVLIPSVPWHQYGVDVEQYLLASDESRDLVHQSGWVFHDM
ncbi:LADA_0F14928g1_1 [Lachancea dasiensis]|uniref:LADA_0F14928g1_1 n=1 Tax=Lachancea dasiensis TaxID=1072105 RepID=A0A1G4JNQ6_9SACH|nr:LADA_0F14928g1_1 [Lachancea dasiensis]